jgi:hypothetical protein
MPCRQRGGEGVGRSAAGRDPAGCPSPDRTGQDALAVAQESGVVDGAGGQALGATARQAADDGSGICDAVGVATDLRIPDRGGGATALRGLVRVGASGGPDASQRALEAGARRGGDGGASSGVNLGALEGGSGHGILGGTQQSVLGDQAQSPRLLIQRVSGRRAASPFEVAMELGFGETVVLCVKTFHGRRTLLPMTGNGQKATAKSVRNEPGSCLGRLAREDGGEDAARRPMPPR